MRPFLTPRSQETIPLSPDKEVALNIHEIFQTVDRKKEKHAPAVECPAVVKAGEPFAVTVSVGREQPHPNPTEHFIAWIEVNFGPPGSRFAHHLTRFDFRTPRESTQGPNPGPVYAHPMAAFPCRSTNPAP